MGEFIHKGSAMSTLPVVRQFMQQRSPSFAVGLSRIHSNSVRSMPPELIFPMQIKDE